MQGDLRVRERENLLANKSINWIGKVIWAYKQMAVELLFQSQILNMKIFTILLNLHLTIFNLGLENKFGLFVTMFSVNILLFKVFLIQGKWHGQAISLEACPFKDRGFKSRLLLLFL